MGIDETRDEQRPGCELVEKGLHFGDKSGIDLS